MPCKGFDPLDPKGRTFPNFLSSGVLPEMAECHRTDAISPLNLLSLITAPFFAYIGSFSAMPTANKLN